MATHIHAPYLVLEQVIPLFLGLSQENNQERTQWKFYFEREDCPIIAITSMQDLVKLYDHLSLQ